MDGGRRRMEWTEDKKWSDRFIPEIKRIIADVLICVAPIEEDMQRNSDLVVLKMDSVRVACRIRRHGYLEKYGDQFTIRAGRPSGIKTELSKIIEGWGDFLFYGFSDQEEKLLVKASMIDLDVFRLEFMRQLHRSSGRIPGISKTNHDNSSDLLAFEFKDFPPELVVKKYIKPVKPAPVLCLPMDLQEAMPF